MDCLTYRRIKLATPQDSRPEIIAHEQSCNECASFNRQLEAFERDLGHALQVSVPEGLAEKIILRTGKPRWSNMGRIATAAAVLISLGALVLLNVAPTEDRFGRQFVHHVLSEPQVATTRAELGTGALELALAEFGGQLKQDIGTVRYIGKCNIGGVNSTHVEITTSVGDAALLLRPGRSADIGTPEIHEGQAVVVVSVPRGSLAIVAATPRQAAEIRSEILRKTEFRS